jgi:hypothetical protein
MNKDRDMAQVEYYSACVPRDNKSVIKQTTKNEVLAAITSQSVFDFGRSLI